MPTEPLDPNLRLRRGRGAVSSRPGRYEPRAREAFDDGWGTLDEVRADGAPRTHVQPEHPRRIISRNDSPDLGFDRSLNPYQGCEHGCVYCYARPSHAYNGLGAGLDFETRIFSKPTAPALLRAELSAPGYAPETLVIGGNTDPYQPAERLLGITRGVLQVLDAFGHPTGLITKGRGILRDLDVLASMASRDLVRVAVSVTTLDPLLSRTLEPRAAPPEARLAVIRRLLEAGVPVIAMVAPVIPAVNDAEIESILAAVVDAGAQSAGYVLLRLPREVGPLMEEWLDAHLPLRRDHVLELVRQCRGGGLNQAEFGTRMRGTGPYAALIAKRVELARKRLGIMASPAPLARHHFAVPPKPGDQLPLFG